jgi:hypothetical protein
VPEGGKLSVGIQNGCEHRKCRTAPSALQLGDSLPFEDWITVGQNLDRFMRASAWWLGDWLVYGERAYGQRYKAALSVTSLDYQTLRNYAWVARSVEASRRRDSLSFQHHAALAALPEPEQELWLQRAERYRWSRNELRRHLLASRRPSPTTADTDAPEPDAIVLRIQVPKGRQRRWREAASAVNRGLMDWIAEAADQAADTLLEGEPGDLQHDDSAAGDNGRLTAAAVTHDAFEEPRRIT